MAKDDLTDEERWQPIRDLEKWATLAQDLQHAMPGGTVVQFEVTARTRGGLYVFRIDVATRNKRLDGETAMILQEVCARHGATWQVNGENEVWVKL